MSYLFARLRRGSNKQEEDNHSNMTDSQSVADSSVSLIASSDGDGESSPEGLSPGNSPGEAPTARRAFGFRKVISEYWFQDKGKNPDEKYHPLASNSEDNLVASMDVVDEMERDERLSQVKEAFRTKEMELKDRIEVLEKDLRNCQLENEMLTIMVEDLVKLQETHQEQIDGVKKFYEDKILDSNSSHEVMIHELILSNQKQVEEFISNHEGLVEDLINSHEQQIREWKVAFAADIEKIPELKDEKSALGIPSKMRDKFLGLSQVSQGLVIVGIGILGSVVGLTSWRFIFWAWPKLVSFAATIEAADVLNVINWLHIFMRSAAYQKFVKCMETGEPITVDTIKDFGTDALGFALTHLAPSLLGQAKTSKQAQISVGNAARNDVQF